MYSAWSTLVALLDCWIGFQFDGMSRQGCSRRYSLIDAWLIQASLPNNSCKSCVYAKWIKNTTKPQQTRMNPRRVGSAGVNQKRFQPWTMPFKLFQTEEITASPPIPSCPFVPLADPRYSRPTSRSQDHDHVGPGNPSGSASKGMDHGAQCGVLPCSCRHT